MTLYLIDKSALVRYRDPVVYERLELLAAGDEVATCAMVDMELLYSARNLDDYERVLADRGGYRRLPINEDTFGQALAVQRLLAETGRHRRPIPDLLIAATAILSGATVLHYDHDFEIIAEVSDLLHEWVAPSGTL